MFWLGGWWDIPETILEDSAEEYESDSASETESVECKSPKIDAKGVGCGNGVVSACNSQRDESGYVFASNTSFSSDNQNIHRTTSFSSTSFSSSVSHNGDPFGANEGSTDKELVDELRSEREYKGSVPHFSTSQAFTDVAPILEALVASSKDVENREHFVSKDGKEKSALVKETMKDQGNAIKAENSFRSVDRVYDAEQNLNPKKLEDENRTKGNTATGIHHERQLKFLSTCSESTHLRGKQIPVGRISSFTGQASDSKFLEFRIDTKKSPSDPSKGDNFVYSGNDLATFSPSEQNQTTMDVKPPKAPWRTTNTEKAVVVETLPPSSETEIRDDIVGIEQMKKKTQEAKEALHGTVTAFANRLLEENIELTRNHPSLLMLTEGSRSRVAEGIERFEKIQRKGSNRKSPDTLSTDQEESTLSAGFKSDSDIEEFLEERQEVSESKSPLDDEIDADDRMTDMPGEDGRQLGREDIVKTADDCRDESTKTLTEGRKEPEKRQAESSTNVERRHSGSTRGDEEKERLDTPAPKKNNPEIDLSYVGKRRIFCSDESTDYEDGVELSLFEPYGKERKTLMSRMRPKKLLGKIMGKKK